MAANRKSVRTGLFKITADGAATGHGLRFLLFAAFLLFVFLTGGASRSEVMSLPFLRVVSALVIGFALVGISRAEIASISKPLILCGIMTALIAIQLIPLPPSIWTAFPGRSPLLDTYTALGTKPGWRPITMIPYLTWNSLFSLVVPVAVILAFSRLHWIDRRRVLLVLAAIGLLSTLIAVIQISGEPGGPFYFYAITNPTAGVGLFANRNHQGFLIAAVVPILIACWQLGQTRDGFPKIAPALMIGLVLFFFVLLLATGSRAALLLGGAGLIAGLALIAPSARTLVIGVKKKRSIDLRIALPVAAVIIAVVLAIFTDRTEAINRLADQPFDEELRLALWPPIGEMLRASFPVGFGVGTFAEMYRWFEPEALLRLSYVNQAHNDLIDLFLSFGILGAVPLFAGLFFWFRALPAAIRAKNGASFDGLVMRRLGVWIVLVLGAASLVDYPLRIPSLAALFMLAMAWATGAASDPDAGKDRLR